MGVKRLGLALGAALALAVVFASGAFAAASTTNGYWYLDSTQLASGETRELNCSAAEPFKLKGTVSGVETEIEAKKLECPSGAAIKQNAEHAEVTGTLKFSELKVLKPSGCGIGASITTNALTEKVQMEGSTVYVKIAPTEGTTIASVPLTGCVIAGTYLLKGSVFGKTSFATLEEEIEQTLTFSESIQNTAGGSLTLAGQVAQITGAANNELTSGTGFAAYEQVGPVPKVEIKAVPAGFNFAVGEEKEIKIEDNGGTVNWQLQKVELSLASGTWGLNEAVNCQNKAVTANQGFVCKVKVKCVAAGVARFRAYHSFGAPQVFGLRAQRFTC